MSSRLCTLLLSLFSLSLFLFPNDPTKPWTNKAELSLVATQGNTHSQSWGFKNDFDLKLPNGDFECKLGAIQVDSTHYERKAVGTPHSWSLNEKKDVLTTAENVQLDLKYNQQLNSKSYWFSAGDWDANKFAGINNRTSISSGVGYKWRQSQELVFKTDYGLQYTWEEPVFEPENYQDSFASLRLSHKLIKQISTSSKFRQDFKAEINLSKKSDFLAILNNNLDVAINSHLALKVGGILRYDNDPAFIQIDLFESEEATHSIGQVPYQKEQLDTTLTTSLVINF